jgi:hypothetical protein
MKREIFVVAIFSAVILIISCSKSFDDIPVFDLSTDPEFETIYLSEICESIEYMPINSSGSLIGRAFAYRIKDGILEIGTPDELLLVETSTGTIKSHLNKRGKGPGQYQSISSFDISPNGDRIYILDRFRQFIHIYDKNCSEINRIKLSSFASQLFLWNDSTILLYTEPMLGNEELSFVLLSVKGDTLDSVKNKFIYSAPQFVVSQGLMPSFRIGPDFYYKEQMDDTLFCFDYEMLPEPVAVFNTGDYRLTREKRESLDEATAIDPGVEALRIHSVFSIHGYHLFSYDYSYRPRHEEGLKYGIGNKKTHEAKPLRGEGFVNDLDGGIPFFPHIQIDQNYLIQIVDPYKLILHKSQPESDIPPSGAFKDLCNLIDEGDNPVLVICKLKNSSG